MAKNTRREFLERAVGAVGAGVTLTAFGRESLLAEALGTARDYAAGRHAIELDGVTAGWVQSAEGGHASADVVSQTMGGVQYHGRPGAKVRYEDITVNCGAGMSRGFYEWIKVNLDHKYARKNGAVVEYDFNYKEVSRMEWTNGLISEVGFPALDAASKDAAKMTVRIRPESTRTITRRGGTSVGPKMQAPQKRWLPANFRLQIPNLDCTRVNRIEALQISLALPESGVGEMRTHEQQPTRARFPDLVATLPESQDGGFYKWHQDFVARGSRAAKKNGRLDYLTPDGQVLFTLGFRSLEIFKFAPERMQAHNENIRRVQAGMHCEDITFSYGPGASA